MASTKYLRNWGERVTPGTINVVPGYCTLNLNLRRKRKKRLPSRNPEPLVVPVDINQCWSIGFMSVTLADWADKHGIHA